MACRQLGYDQGALHYEIGQTTLGQLAKIDQSTKDQTLSISCHGEEANLARCQWRSGEQCNRTAQAVSLVCKSPSLSLCPYGYVPFQDKCYGFFEEPLSFLEAQNYCHSSSGHLVEIKDQMANDFLSEYALRRNNVQSYWTGGVVTNVVGLQLGVWHSSKKSIEFNKFWKPAETTQASGVVLDLHNNYYFWSSKNLSIALSFICERPFKDIGCLKDSVGAEYQGNATRTGNGEECLSWKTPGLIEIFPNQAQWDHNFCRNQDGVEESPICFVDNENYDYCDIPRCGQQNQRREVSPDLEFICKEAFPSTSGSSHADLNEGTCPPEQFSCQPGECIYSQFVCDGEPDCSNGFDEANCIDYLSLYAIDQGFKLKTDDLPKIGVSEQECAKLCAQSKHCTCNSFAYNIERKRCLLGNRYSNVPFDSLLERKAWNYYSFNGSLDNGCNRVKRPASSEIEGLRLVSGPNADIVNIKINGTWGGLCDDSFSTNEADVICRQLGYDLGAEEVINGQGTNPNDSITLHDMHCQGTELHISQCSFEDHEAHVHYCAGTEKAGLKCRKTVKLCEDFEFHCKNRECIHVNDLCDGTPQCGDGSDEKKMQCSSPLQVRLVDGPDPRTGRIEVRHKGTWGTVCDDHFGHDEAKVICRMLGFPYENAKVYNGTNDYSGDGPVWIRLQEDQTCSGNEMSITECKEQHLWVHDHHCEHAEDVAITCEDHSSDVEIIQPFVSPPIPLDDGRIYEEDKLSNEATISIGGPAIDCGRNRLTGPIGPFGSRIDPSNGPIRPRIRGGDSAFYGDHPWQASIRIKGFNESYHWCGATIISHFHLISAAHCLKDFPKSSYFIRVGDHSLDLVENDEAEYDIESIRFHENFNMGPYLNNDIALITIRSENRDSGMDFGMHVSPICLPSPSLPIETNFNVTISGWGRLGYDIVNDNDDTSIPRQNRYGAVIELQAAKIPVLPMSRCTSEEVRNDMLFIS